MPSESSEQRVSSKGNNQVGAPPPETEQLQCPRCDSNNTKFCYYNNYNFSQPRHFCKSCRRYWTHGGTLRDIPVGGGTRKNAKRSRTMHVTSTGSTTTTSLSYSSSSTYSSNYRDYCHVPGTGTATSAFLAPLAGREYGGGPALPFMSDVKPVSSNFTSLLNTHGPGFFALGGIGLDDVGFGLGRAVSVWPFSEVQGGGSCVTGAGAVSVLGNAWQMQSGVEGGIGDCFTLSDVVTGNGMK